MKRVLYPGSFDPITKGHMNIIEEASYLFDEVVVGILENSLKKNKMFTLDERLEMIDELYKNNNNIIVISSTQSAVDVALEYECQAIIRGIRNIRDYDYEIELQEINKELSNNKIKTVCLFAEKEYQYISSTLIKELLRLEKDPSNYIDPLIKEKIFSKRKYNNE